MDKTLKLIGRSSNEIYVLRYPSALLNFFDYDLSYFAKRAVEACSDAQKTGEADFDRFAELRRDIQTSHCYIEHHIRTIYEKLPIDCYIDYICRRDSIGTNTLWNRYVSCRTPFEKMLFQRLCEFRYNRAINEWLNILRVRDYALSKIDFVFPNGIKSVSEASARRNYFDLMLSVTASEMGCRLDELGQTKVFSVGRLPNAPFMFPTISKDIMRGVLADFDYSDDYSDIKSYEDISDEIAMDAFSRMKNGLVAEQSSYNIFRSKMEKYDKIYMPCSFKAVVDLEIDAVIESGGYLAVCKKCGRRYYRGKDYDEDYCGYLHNGKSCLEEYLEENPPKRMTEELEEKSRSVTNAVYSHVGSSMSTKEYENWYSYMTAMKGKVQSGEISPEEFDEFLDYSLNVDISRSKPIVEVPKANMDKTGKERVVKPFVPERIERSTIKSQIPQDKELPEESGLPEFSEFAELSKKKPNDGFFVSPTVARRSSERRISHIIRAGETVNDESNFRPDPAGFRPFGQEERDNEKDKRVVNDSRIIQERGERFERPERPERSDQFGRFERPGQSERSERSERPESRFYEDRYNAEEFKPEIRQPEIRSAPKEDQGFESQLLAELEALRGKTEPKQPSGFSPFIETSGFSAEIPDNTVASNASDPEKGVEKIAKESEEPEKPVSAPRARVIRKNAAAISAYGKMSGTPTVSAMLSAPPEIELVSRANADESEAPATRTARITPEINPDTEPFKDVGSIFDVLENSTGNKPVRSHSEQPPRERSERSERRGGFDAEEPAPEWTEPEESFRESPREYPDNAARRRSPSAARTEDRASAYRGGDNYEDIDEDVDEDNGEESRSELDMLKAKKQHPKSNKTKRLVDMIMREPDDNPNFRKK